jgi:DNA repair photolyase
LLRHELDTTHRKSPLPPYVVFSTYTDGFLGGSEVLEVSRACLEIILNRRVGVSLSTRGAIPDDALAVLGRHPSHVQVTVPLVSLSEEYTRAWEPGTALPRDRLFLVQRLLQLGIVPRLRVEPLIPFVNDHTEMLRELVSALVGLGLTEATLGFLHLRPGVGDQMRKEAPVDLQRLVLGCFPTLSESPDRKFHHLPEKQRLAGLRRIQRIGREHGLRVSACHCQNPGLPASRCPVAPPELPRQRGNQQELDLPLAEEQAPADREIPDEKE